MRTTPRGIRQMLQAIHDFGAGRRVRFINADGQVDTGSTGRDSLVTDAVLRNTYPRAGDGPVTVPAPTTAAERLGNKLGELATAVNAVECAVAAVEAVRAEDGSSAIDALGADKADCEAWRNILFDVLEKLPVWKQTGIHRHGAAAEVDDADRLGDDPADADDDVALDGTVDEDDLTELDDEEGAV
jgi:hypothetical protein